MIYLLAARGASTKLRSSPFTETAIAGVQSVVYRTGVEPVPASGADGTGAPQGTFGRGMHRLSGVIFSYDGSAAETLLGIEDAVDLIVRYTGSGEKRRRTFLDIVFVGDATVTIPGRHRGIPELIAVPFRVQIPLGNTLGDHVQDVSEP